MTVSRKSLRSGLLIGLVMVFVAIIGMLTTFSERYIISDALTLGDTILFGTFLVAGMYAARQIGKAGPAAQALNGALAAIIIVILLVPAVLLATEVNQRAINSGMDSVFPNVTSELVDKLSLERDPATTGYLMLAVAAAVLGALGSQLFNLPPRVRSIVALSLTMIVVLGMLQEQIRGIISLPDAIWVTLFIAAGYALAVIRPQKQMLVHFLEAAFGGAALALVLTGILFVLGADKTSVPDFLSNANILKSFIIARSTIGLLVLMALVGAGLGATGAALSGTSGTIHRAGMGIITALLVLGVLNSTQEMTLVAAVLVTATIAVTQLLTERTTAQAETTFAGFDVGQRRASQVVIGIAGLALILIIPQLLTGYINNVVDLIGLYLMMGLGLNIVVGFAGLLDLGYVAFFTIGAYTVGILTTPNVITCPPPNNNVIVMQQSLVSETPLDAEYSLLRNEPIGVVSGSQSTYAALVIPRAEVVPFENIGAAMAALQSGEVTAVVGKQDVLSPYLTDSTLYSTPKFRPPNELWPARGFTAAEQAAWCHTLPFWAAWPIAVLASGLAGVLLGIPVLRLRGDYLAIVTLGFGEIVRLIALSDLGKPYFGGAQGIVSIPSPTINLTGISRTLVDSGIPVIKQVGEAIANPIALSQPDQIYYLILFGVVATLFVSLRLSRSRLGRAWLAMRADEDVAQAMGINLVQTKLLAFSIGAAFSGIGGAIFGAYLKSIFPNSFTLIVSINVLSLIIIGGLGSMPGVMVGTLVIFGLPEALREFAEYRLLMFGALLVIMMLLRPEGIIPPTSARLEEQAEKAMAEEGA